MKVNDACHHCNTNKLLTIYLQPLQKKKQKQKKPRKELVCSHRTQWKTLHSFIFFSVCSFQDWSMWSVRISDWRERGKKKKVFTIGFLIVLIGSLEKKKKVSSKCLQTSPPESERELKHKKTNKNLQSLPSMARYMLESWMQALAIYIQHPLSWHL